MQNQLKYWYFRFTKDFFKDKAVRDLKQIPIYGYQYGWIYLEMCSLCLQDGSYILKVPRYTPASSYVDYIAGEINEDTKIVGQAISWFVNHGFIEISENPYEVSMNFIKMQNNMGKSSSNADRMRLARKESLELEGKKQDLLEDKNGILIQEKETPFDDL